MLLSIEAAVGGGSISLLSGDSGEPIASESDAEITRAENLLPRIDLLMRNSSLTREDISALAVSAGPGSFTGIRIGLATALGLAYGKNIKISSVSVLRAMAFSVPDDLLTTGIPMGRGAICIQAFRSGQPTSEPRTISESEFGELVASSPHPIAMPRALAPGIDERFRIVDADSSLATLVGQFCHAHPGFYEAPIFVSKSF